MKIVYIAHPVAGDVRGNIAKIIEIVKQINALEPDVVPFVPYLADIYALDDNDPTERARGIKNGLRLLNGGFIDEVRLYGDRISDGMATEVAVAHDNAIIVRPMTPETKKAYSPTYKRGGGCKGRAACEKSGCMLCYP